MKEWKFNFRIKHPQTAEKYLEKNAKVLDKANADKIGSAPRPDCCRRFRISAG